jgi:hypothetical protein
MAARVMPGTISLSSSSHFAPRLYSYERKWRHDRKNKYRRRRKYTRKYSGGFRKLATENLPAVLPAVRTSQGQRRQGAEILQYPMPEIGAASTM